ncbi:C-Maf-inducing protein-like [Homalodisca vitripennis]|uniref:C-Maf-inducing protein-like n=1 Tax=Homalodisca vitripennis TaxID=197043 RepID=UPI001EEB7ED6|nr:C-Maf-inducing protein-like [Homalodisca vitripennis]
MESDVSSDLKTCLETLESYDEIEVISENKELPRDVDSSSDSLCSPSVTVLRPPGVAGDSPQSDSSVPPSSPIQKYLETDMPGPAKGPRYKLLTEGDLQVCCLNHTRTVISKILSSKFLRRWESHRLYLNDACISSKTPMGFLDMSIPYTALQEVYVVSRWDTNHKFCIRLVVPNGSILLQASNAYIRDQWYHSILWKKNIFKYQNLLTCSTRPEVILKEMKNLVEMSINTPLHDECVYQVPIDIFSRLLMEEEESWSGRLFSEELISTLAPLLENCPPSAEMCHFFSRHCVSHPRSPLVSDALTPVVYRILKHNVDFGKHPLMKKLVQDYIQALYTHNDNEEVINKFVASVHGPSSGCPHPRVLPNLVSVCLSAIFNIFEISAILEERNHDQIQEDRASRIDCYLQVFRTISEYDDWRPGLAQLLQPVPVPDDALTSPHFIKSLSPVIERIGTSTDCDTHQMVLGVRDGKEGWLDIFCPSSLACIDDGVLWGQMLETLLGCCCKRKRFVAALMAKRLGACLLLALRENRAAQSALCLALEWDLLPEPDQRLTVATTLQSTTSGSQSYAALCQRQLHLQELHKKGGPRKLTLPSRSTDSDVIRLLSCGALGNLECLSLAFTHVTSACAEHIIKLPGLRYLNLWATQFGDAGLLIISEHLPKLQVLNLCETPVSDKGIAALTAMTNLRKLNLNSTKLSAQTFEVLKSKLPALQELDVRYTEAW